jgi:hypothetical protein
MGLSRRRVVKRFSGTLVRCGLCINKIAPGFLLNRHRPSKRTFWALDASLYFHRRTSDEIGVHEKARNFETYFSSSASALSLTTSDEANSKTSSSSLTTIGCLLVRSASSKCRLWIKNGNYITIADKVRVPPCQGSDDLSQGILIHKVRDTRNLASRVAHW